MTWFCPSLGRPNNLKRLADLWETAGVTKLHVRLMEDDKELDKYLSISYPDAWEIKIGKRLFLSQMLNEFADENPKENCYGFIGDDVVPITNNWARRLEEEAGDWFLSFPDDEIHHGNLCPHMCVGGELLRAIGWWGNPLLHHSFIDNTLMTIGASLELCQYVEEVKFEHWHPIIEKADMDNTYWAAQKEYQRDEYFFHQWTKEPATFEHLRRILNAYRAGGMVRNRNKRK